MKTNFFKQNRRFEAYFEMRDKRILDRFFDLRVDGRDYEFWFGSFYFTIHFYIRKVRPAS